MLLQEKLTQKVGHIQKYSYGYGEFHHVTLAGQASPIMKYQSEDYLVWCLNDYLGLMNHEEIKTLEARFVSEYGS